MNQFFKMQAAAFLLCGASLMANDQDKTCEYDSTFQLKKDEVSSASSYNWPKYHKLTFKEDYSGLKNHQNIKKRDLFDNLKHIALADDVHLSLGGQARIRFEDYRNYNFGTPAVNDDSYILQRYLLHADLHIGDHFRFFVESVTALTYDRELPGERHPTLHDKLDIMNAFVDLNIPLNDSLDARLRLGRFEFYYGKGRMLACRNWSQLRRPYDGAKLKISHKNWWVEAFWAQGTQNLENEFNRVNDDLAIWGVYSHISKKSGLPFGLDLYAIAKDKYNPNGEDDHRMNLGARIFGTFGESALSYDIEYTNQFDIRDSKQVSAEMFSAELEYQWKQVALKPALTLGFDWATGDSNPTDDTTTTFEPISPFGHYYFGYIDVIGRQNIISPWIRLRTKPTKKLTTTIEGHWFFTDESEDNIYNACNCSKSVRTGNENADSYIGFEIDLVAKYKFNHHLVGLVGYSYLWAGDYINDTTGGKEDIQRFMLQMQYTF